LNTSDQVTKTPTVYLSNFLTFQYDTNKLTIIETRSNDESSFLVCCEGPLMLDFRYKHLIRVNGVYFLFDKDGKKEGEFKDDIRTFLLTEFEKHCKVYDYGIRRSAEFGQTLFGYQKTLENLPKLDWQIQKV